MLVGRSLARAVGLVLIWTKAMLVYNASWKEAITVIASL